MKFLLRTPLFLLILAVSMTGIVSGAGAGDRLKKLDAQGQELSDEAAIWAMVLDNKEELYWEVKSLEDSIHSNQATYSFADAKEKFIAQLNAEKFGGFSDWRLPKSDELSTLKVRKTGDEALIDLQYFPHTQPSRYMSLGWCGSKAEYQEENVKFGKQKSESGKHVRAVRGKPLD